MSYGYLPNSNISPTSPYTTVLLSQRDLGLQVPINFVTAPGISLTNACFAKQVYADDAAQACFSNLLAIGFQRFEVDLYWDEGRSLWSLCPVAFPLSTPIPSLTSTVANGTNHISRATSTSVRESPGSGSLRQVTTTSSTTLSVMRSANATLETPSSLGSISPTSTTPTSSPNETLVHLGPYTCSSTMNLSNLLSQLLGYIQTTETTLAANVLYFIFNIHAASSSTSPKLPASSPTRLPDSSNLLGTIFAANLSDFLYTPENLYLDRQNLNSTWYTVTELYRPTSDYYTTFINTNNIYSTISGWPSESYIEFSLGKRMLLQWGAVDLQMANYNFTADAGVFFNQSYIQSTKTDVVDGNNGEIVSGCYLVGGTSNLSISNINSSWAAAATVSGFNYATASSDITPIMNLSSRMTDCGISPILNVTLLNSTADENFIPYLNISYSAVWSWAAGEPKNYSFEESDATFSCVTSNLNLGGRWMASDCSQKYFAACRAVGQPYNWTFTSFQVDYYDASQACSGPYIFAAPRTALENSFLTQAMRSSNEADSQKVWVDFNSLNVAGCWVTGGANSTCPYFTANDALARQAVLVPTIASIIVIIIAAIVAFLKIVGHRQIRKKKRRRMHDDVLYEGIPS